VRAHGNFLLCTLLLGNVLVKLLLHSQCCDHDFWRFSQVFGEFRRSLVIFDNFWRINQRFNENQCYDQFCMCC
jgi:hypothetical protein